jgi:hypothetical protein
VGAEAEVKDRAWAKEILPFLRYPDKVDDPDFKLASVVIGCIDKWLPAQKLGFPSNSTRKSFQTIL